MKANTIEEFFGTLLYSKTETHKSHLETGVHRDHITLNEFYDDIVDLVDSLIEAYQGLHGKVKDYKNLLTTSGPDAVEYFEDLREMVADGREKYCKESELQSICDSILELIDSTLYKLKEFSESKTPSKMRSLYEALKENMKK